jgi:hypothetical protein
VCLYYKYFPISGDTMIVNCKFYKNGSVIGKTSYGTTQTVSSWTPLIAPVTYTTAETPDSATIILSCFSRVPRGDSKLYIDNISFNTLITSVDHTVSAGTPAGFALAQNYPNPFNPTTNIMIVLPVQSRVRLSVLDVLGREVSILLADELGAGTYTRQWNASAMPSGMYFYRLQAGSFTETKKLLLVR